MGRITYQEMAAHRPTSTSEYARPMNSSLSTRPVREPVLTETMRVGIVARDLDAAMRKDLDDYGIGLWDIDALDGPSRGRERRAQLTDRAGLNHSPFGR